MIFTELWSTHPDDVGGLDSTALRERFIVPQLFSEGAFSFVYSHDDRLLIGGVHVEDGTVPLDSPEELNTPHLLARREAALVGLDGSLVVASSAGSFTITQHDVLYLPLGTTGITLSGTGTAYLVSAPAHSANVAALAARDDVEAVNLGSVESANERTIRKYIHADGIASNQLVLGITTLAPGSVWNTMPAHVHSRRTEIYLYDGLGESPLIHLMGEPDATHHLMLHDRDAVISPPWSVHSGVATQSYSFIWAMAGENIDYGDVLPIAPRVLR